MPIDLSGMSELLNRLQSIGGNVKAVEKRALIKGAMVIRQAMSDAAPTGVKNPQTWQFKAGKKYAIYHLKDNIVVSKVKGSGVMRYIEVGPGRHFFYARFLEFGTVKMPSQKFMEPAFLAKKQEAKDAMKEVIAEAIRNV